MRWVIPATAVALVVSIGLPGVSARQAPASQAPPGQIRHTIEGLPTFVADQGDIVYVPKQRWHLASFAGDGMAARLAMNGYPDLAHSFEAPDAGRGATR